MTPTSNLGRNGGSQPPEKRRAADHRPTLADEIEHLPTPRASDPGNESSRAGHGFRPQLGEVVRDPDRFAEYADAVAHHEAVFGVSAPDPTVPGRKGKRRLNPRFVEWMMVLPAGWVTDVPGLSLREQLHVLGNGVVPAQAAAAIADLLEGWWPGGKDG